MDLLARFFTELSSCFSRPVLLGKTKEIEILAPSIVASDLSMKQEEELFLLAGTLELVVPLLEPLRLPEGKETNPSCGLGFFLLHTKEFKGSFAGEEKLSVFSKDKMFYSTLSIEFYSYPLTIPTIFSIKEVVQDFSAS